MKPETMYRHDEALHGSSDSRAPRRTVSGIVPIVRQSEVSIRLTDDGLALLFEIPLVRVPDGGGEQLEQFVRTANANPNGTSRLELRDGFVFLGFHEQSIFLDAQDMATLIQELLALGAHYRRMLSTAFEADAVFAAG